MVTEGLIFYFDWEMKLMEWLQAHISNSGFVFSILSNLSALGEQMVMVAVMGFLYWGLNKEFGKYVGVNILMVNIWNPMIKNVVLRLRPYFVKEYNVKLLRLIDTSADQWDVAAQGYSFPSGHSSGAVTVYGSLACHEKNRKWLWVLAIVLPILVGFSRVFVGAHFPTDVLSGWVLGILVILIVSLLRRVIKKSWLFNLILVLATIPGFFYCNSADYFTAVGIFIGFMGGTLLDDYRVHFEDTRKPIFMVTRLLGGLLVYLVLNHLLKMPFSNEFLSDGSTAAMMVRCARYAIVAFVDFGVYPMLFKLEKTNTAK